MAWPTTNNPREKIVTIRLTDDEADDLDRYAKSRGLSRSRAVRDAVDRVIAAHQRKQTKQKREPKQQEEGSA